MAYRNLPAYGIGDTISYMQAAVLHSRGAKLKVEYVEKPVCGQEEILLRVMSCGICGSDLRIFKYGNQRVKFPAILGHEIAGIIIEKGESVKEFFVGDRVAVGADIPCGDCDYCTSGFPNNCKVNLAIGYQYPGGFAEFIKVDRKVWGGGPFQRIPDHVSFDEAALAEPLGCAINGLEILPNRLKNSIVIIGAGVLGCMFTELSRIFGYNKVFLVDIDKEKFVLVKRLGFYANEYCGFDENIVNCIKDLTSGKGADAVVVACADPRAQIAAVEMAAKRGAVNFFAGSPPDTAPLSLPANVIHYNEIFLTGSHGSTPVQHARALQLISEGKIHLKNLITHSFSLKDINESFAMFDNPRRLKIVVKPSANI